MNINEEQDKMNINEEQDKMNINDRLLILKLRLETVRNRLEKSNEDQPRDERGRWSGNATVLHRRDVQNRPSEDSPHKKSIVHDPSTGSKRPYEVWAHYPPGNSRRLASFKSEESAKNSVWWKRW